MHTRSEWYNNFLARTRLPTAGEWAYIPLDSSAVTFKNDALARVQEVVDANAARRAAFTPPYFPPAGLTPPTAPGLSLSSTCHSADLAEVVKTLGTAFRALDGSSGRRAGELKPALASTAQKD